MSGSWKSLNLDWRRTMFDVGDLVKVYDKVALIVKTNCSHSQFRIYFEGKTVYAFENEMKRI